MHPAKDRRPATYADLESVPEHMVAEILDGELHTSPRPSPRHSLAAYTLGMELGSAHRRGPGGPGAWWLLVEPEIHLAADVVVPDVAGWRVERLPSVPETAYLELAPDWLCEVLSPSTERIDRVRKLAIYRREGVGHVWLVNPLQRTLEVYRSESDRWALLGTYAGDDRVRAEPFVDIELELAALWGEAGAPPPP